jgi:hypothetical protein
MTTISRTLRHPHRRGQSQPPPLEQPRDLVPALHRAPHPVHEGAHSQVPGDQGPGPPAPAGTRSFRTTSLQAGRRLAFRPHRPGRPPSVERGHDLRSDRVGEEAAPRLEAHARPRREPRGPPARAGRRAPRPFPTGRPGTGRGPAQVDAFVHPQPEHRRPRQGGPAVSGSGPRSSARPGRPGRTTRRGRRRWSRASPGAGTRRTARGPTHAHPPGVEVVDAGVPGRAKLEISYCA